MSPFIRDGVELKKGGFNREREQRQGVSVSTGKAFRGLVSPLQRQRQEDGQKGGQEDSWQGIREGASEII